MARKKKKIDEGSGPDVGMVMTISLFLILLTFFILLNSIAILDENRTRVALGSLIGAFGGLPGGLSPLDNGDSILPPTAPMVNEELTLEQLMEYMNSNTELAGLVKITPVKHGERITISDKVLFEGERKKIRPDLAPFLLKLCRLINSGDFPVEIVGHTDDSTAREKGHPSNWELASFMAIQVLKYFVSEGNVATHRLTAYGQGSYQPLVPNDTQISREQNRRVEIDLKYDAPMYLKRIYQKKSPSYFTYKKFDFKIF